MAKPRGRGLVGASPGIGARIPLRPSGRASGPAVVSQSARPDPLDIAFAEGAQLPGRFIRARRPPGADGPRSPNQPGAVASSLRTP